MHSDDSHPTLLCVLSSVPPPLLLHRQVLFILVFKNPVCLTMAICGAVEAFTGAVWDFAPKLWGFGLFPPFP